MKTWIQYGTFSIIIMLAAIITCVSLLIITGFEETFPILIVGLVVLTLIVCLLIFYKLTITIDDSQLEFRMGIGLISKKYLLSDIASCTPVKNSPIWGIGIRMIPSGWLYNVSGLGAIELTFKNSKTKIRIGTDKADEIALEVNGKITSATGESFYEKGGHSGMYLPLALVTAAIIFVAIMVVEGRKPARVIISESAITIRGMYGMDVRYSDIIGTDTLQSLPEIKSRTNGFASGRFLKGHFKLEDGSAVMLFIKKGIPPYIFIRTDQTTIYLNFDRPAKTRDVFQSVLSGNKRGK